jgi:hypothetical protein
MVNGLPLPLITGEQQTIASASIAQIAAKNYQPQKRALQYRISDEAFINDNYGVLKGGAMALKQVFQQAKETAAAVYMNGALTAATISTPLGQPLSSTAQPLESGTDSNTFAVQQTLGIIALEDATSQLMQQKAHKGYAAPKFGPFQIEVAPRNNHLSARLIGADLFPTTPNNDKNSVAGNGQMGRVIGTVTKRVVSPYFTNPEWWCLRSIAEEEQPRYMLLRYGFRLLPLFYDQDTDSWKITAKESYLFDVFDYRGTFYSTPS